MPTVHILDYVAGNVRSLVNAIEKVGHTVQWIKTPEDVQYAEVRDQGGPLIELPKTGIACNSLELQLTGLNNRN